MKVKDKQSPPWSLSDSDGDERDDTTRQASEGREERIMDHGRGQQEQAGGTMRGCQGWCQD